MLLTEAEGKCTTFTNARMHSRDNACVVTNHKFELRYLGLFNGANIVYSKNNLTQSLRMVLGIPSRY